MQGATSALGQPKALPVLWAANINARGPAPSVGAGALPALGPTFQLHPAAAGAAARWQDGTLVPAAASVLPPSSCRPQETALTPVAGRPCHAGSAAERPSLASLVFTRHTALSPLLPELSPSPLLLLLLPPQPWLPRRAGRRHNGC